MQKRKIVAGTLVAAALGLGGTAIARASSAPDEGQSGPNVQHESQDSAKDSEGGATGSDADRAKEAALKETGGGHANAVERDNEDGATWEVEVTKKDGKTVDVRLDENYKTIVVESDSEDN
jgi:uncharacterized membrane protein YkoI